MAFTENRIPVYTNDGLECQGYTDAVNGLRVRTYATAPTTERYTISSFSNGNVKLTSTNNGDTRFPTGVEAFRLCSLIADLTTAGVTWPTDPGCFPFKDTK